MGHVMLYRPDMQPYEIFDIVYRKSGYPQFLIYHENQWVLRSAKYFTPHYCEVDWGKYVETDEEGRRLDV